MGTLYKASCSHCGHRFEVNEGGGFQFYVLRCDECGRTMLIDAENRAKRNPRISFERSQKVIEKKAGKCRCGGKFTFDAKPRCPKCRSTQFEVDSKSIMEYD